MRGGIVIVVEGVNTGLVGAYGTNTAITPALDRLAAHGLVLDQCFVDSLDRRAQLISLWTGLHAHQHAAENTAEMHWSMWHALSSVKLESCLITDCPLVAKVAEELGCKEVMLVEVQEAEFPADDWTECGLVQVFVAAAEEVAATSEPKLIWIHSRGLRHAWDAPVDLRERFIDPEDPLPPSEVQIPSILIDEDTDPDEVTGWAQVAAAQVAAADRGIDSLFEMVQARSDARNWAWMVISPGGVPLGEHGRVGWSEARLFGEELACVAIIQLTEQPIGSRRAEICQLPDLVPTFLSALGVSIPFERLWSRDLFAIGPLASPAGWMPAFQTAGLFADDGFWLRTPAWSIMQASDSPAKLFVKPDDRWETSDVANRRTDVVDRMQEVADQFKQCLLNCDRNRLPALEDELCDLLR